MKEKGYRAINARDAMGMKNIARQLFPPMVANLFKRHRTTGGEMPRFASYDAALAYCAGIGYQHDKLIEAVCWSTEFLRDRLAAERPLRIEGMDFKYLTAMERAVRDGELHVIDFGGACGGHYFRARAYFGDRVKLRWHVVETSAMVREGRKLESEELRFYESVELAREACPDADMMFTSGAIVYTPDPLAFTRRIVAANARFLYISRQGLLEDNRTVITIQQRKISKGVRPLPPGMEDSTLSYPVTWVPRAAFEAAISEGYQIELHITEEEEHFTLDGRTYRANGYLARRTGL